jgi:hypothetical protein
MNANLLVIVKQIVADQGEGILSEPRRVTAFFADLAKDEPKPQRNAFVKCLEHQSAQLLKNAAEPDREACKQQLAQKMYVEEGLDPGLCRETLELLAAVLFGEEKKKTYCKNCGKELQERWKLCPYCSTMVEDQVPETITPSVNTVNPTGDDTQKGNSEITQLKEELEKTKVMNSQLNDELGNIKYNNSMLKEKLKKTKSGRTAAIWLGIIGVAISIIVGAVNYSEMESRYYNESWRYSRVKSEHDELKAKYDTLLADYEKSKSLFGIEITSIKVGNSDKDNRWLTRPGEPLSSARMRYLKPVITYNSTISENTTFYVKIIQPNGQLFYNASESPSGFTNSTTASINRGSNQSLELRGWGNNDQSNYASGTWTVEVWYNNVCLRSEKVVIGQ